mmetsp:Transcript_21087/g.30472  ORF Transcript_21087/g.30472 Transcript_21087/m.30472 type:complete len:99 (-) Transcript_21087:1070-1366(-)
MAFNLSRPLSVFFICTFSFFPRLLVVTLPPMLVIVSLTKSSVNAIPRPFLGSLDREDEELSPSVLCPDETAACVGADGGGIEEGFEELGSNLPFFDLP